MYASIKTNVRSRRFGNVIEVNPLPTTIKVCSLNCRYCDLGPSEVRKKAWSQLEFPTVASLIDQLRSSIREVKAQAINLDTILLSGNGEPTSHPQLMELINEIIDVRNELLPKSSVGVLTNGIELHQRRVSHALSLVDTVCVKLDGGNSKVLKALQRPLVLHDIDRLISKLRQLQTMTIESMFVNGPHSNCDQSDIEDWLEVLGMLQPKQVYLGTVTRKPTEIDVFPISYDELERIAFLTRQRVNCEVTVLYPCD